MRGAMKCAEVSSAYNFIKTGFPSQAIAPSSLNGGNTGQSSGNWHRLSHDTGIRVTTVLGVVVRAMSNGGYLLSARPEMVV
jgi:hypothetical protein